MARPTSECEFDPDHLYHDHREADELRAENERLRGFLKYLKGEAQDRDDVKLMDEIDRALARP